MNENSRDGKVEIKAGDLWINGQYTINIDCTIHLKNGNLHCDDAPAV